MTLYVEPQCGQPATYEPVGLTNQRLWGWHLTAAGAPCPASQSPNGTMPAEFVRPEDIVEQDELPPCSCNLIGPEETIGAECPRHFQPNEMGTIGDAIAEAKAAGVSDDIIINRIRATGVLP